MKISPLAGKPAPPAMLTDISKLLTAYYTEIPDPSIATQQVVFGTSGHRGSSLDRSFNEWHIWAICQAICQHRAMHNIKGPLFLGMDTHALSVPAHASALEVLVANGIEVCLSINDEYTPTPAVSHAILVHNKKYKDRVADGIVITPSHNPPREGGIKYNPPSGGPADQTVTGWIEAMANEFLANGLSAVKRVSLDKALSAPTTHRYDFLNTYIDDLANVIDMAAIRDSGIRLGVDPLGGAGVHYWHPIAERYGLNLDVVDQTIDPTFRFMPLDWDGQIRMDPSSPYAMRTLIALKDRYDIAFACDTDHDRHGIVTKQAGLMPTNHFLSAAIFYLFQHRPKWGKIAGIGKTVVSSQIIDRIAAKLSRNLYQVPVGFKWFVEGLLDGTLTFVGEESAGASFARMDGNVWTTDKDGLIPGLLAAEITAKTGKDPGEIYEELTHALGTPVFERIDAPATREQKAILKKLSPDDIKNSELGGEKIEVILTKAPGNGASIGGLKVVTENGWFAVRPSGTEDIYKIYAESFLGKKHLDQIISEAQSIVNTSFEKAKG